MRELTKQDFKNLDLREQLTDELKEKWYYKTRKWGLRINKHSVVFDNTFKFECKFHDKEIVKETRDDVIKEDVYINGCLEFKKGEVFHYEKGEVLSEAYISVETDGETLLYCSFDKYDDDLNEILENILLYIANRI